MLTPTRNMSPKSIFGRCDFDVPMATSFPRWRKCKRRLRSGRGWGPDGKFCYQHAALIERTGMIRA